MSRVNRRHRRALMAEINVVPYIDVMLVLLIIFMITAPLLQRGVDVELPVTGAKPIAATDEPPLIISIDQAGQYFVTFDEYQAEPVTPARLGALVVAIVERHPRVQVLVNGDRGVPYGQVVAAMAMLQRVGVAKVGLMTDPVAGPQG